MDDELPILDLKDCFLKAELEYEVSQYIQRLELLEQHSSTEGEVARTADILMLLRLMERLCRL